MDYSLSGSSVHGTLQARMLEGAAVHSFRDCPDPGVEPVSPMSPVLAGGFFTTSATCLSLRLSHLQPPDCGWLSNGPQGYPQLNPWIP